MPPSDDEEDDCVTSGKSQVQISRVIRSTAACLFAVLVFFGIDGSPAGAQEAVCDVNDDFECRAPLDADEPSTVDNAAATLETGERTECALSADRTVWWSWTAATDERVRISSARSSIPTAVAVYLAPEVGAGVAAASLITCGGQQAGVVSYVDFDAVAGTVYAIQVANYDGEIGPVTLAFQPLPSIDVRAGCLGASGLVTLTARNLNPGETLTFEIQGVRRELVADADGSLTTKVTGRRDGTLRYTIYRDDSSRVIDEVRIDCVENPEGPLAIVNVGCLADRGLLRFELFAAVDEGRQIYRVVAGAIDRSLFLDEGSEVTVAVSGRPDGVIPYTVQRLFAGNDAPILSGEAEIDCTPDVPATAVDVVVSCTASVSLRNGTISAEIVAASGSDADVTFRVDGLPDLHRTLAAGERTFLARSGRGDGEYRVQVLADGVIEFDESVTVDCLNDAFVHIEVTGRCVDDRGVITTEIVNGSDDVELAVRVSDLDVRYYSRAAGESVIDVRSGRPNGRYKVEIELQTEFSSSTRTRSQRIACDQTQTCNLAGAEVVVSILRSECGAVRALASAADGSAWNQAVDPCDWSGIDCEGSHIVRVAPFATGLSNLPPEIGQLRRLRWLHLTNRGLESLPDEIGQLSELELLWVDSNRLTTLPDSIGQLTSLDILDIRNNRLEALPDLTGLVSLRSMSACGQGRPVAVQPNTRAFLEDRLDSGIERISCSFPRGVAAIDVTCLGQRGSIAATYRNDTSDTAYLSVTVSGLDPLEAVLGPGEAQTLRRTGRPAGTYDLLIEVNGYRIPSSGLVEVPTCDG